MYAIGVDDHTASSHLTVLESTGRVGRAGRIGNTAAEVRKVVAPALRCCIAPVRCRPALVHDSESWRMIAVMSPIRSRHR
jgi:hypothetical protein